MVVLQLYAISHSVRIDAKEIPEFQLCYSLDYCIVPNLVYKILTANSLAHFECHAIFEH